MRTLIKLIKLAIGLLMLHAAWRAGEAYYQFYEFQDAVQHVAQFSANVSMDSTRSQVMEIAKSLDVPVTWEQVSVRKDENRIFVDAVYSRPIEVVPRYNMPWEFTVHVTAILVPSAR